MSRPSWAEIAGELDGSTEIDALTAELAAARDELTGAQARIAELEAERDRLREGIERHRRRHDIGLNHHYPRPMDEDLWTLLDIAVKCPTCGSDEPNRYAEPCSEFTVPFSDARPDGWHAEARKRRWDAYGGREAYHAHLEAVSDDG